MVPGAQGISSEPNPRYQFKCRRFLDFFWVGFLKDRYINIRNECRQYTTRLQENRFFSCSLLNWLIECLCPSLTNDRRCELLRKSFKNTFWSPILRPLALRPGTTAPPAPHPTLLPPDQTSQHIIRDAMSNWEPMQCVAHISWNRSMHISVCVQWDRRHIEEPDQDEQLEPEASPPGPSCSGPVYLSQRHGRGRLQRCRTKSEK